MVSTQVYSEEVKRFTANTGLTSSLSNPHQFLPAEQAFQLSSEQKEQELILRFQVTPNYYLYKDRFKFQVENGNAILGQAFYSIESEWKDDAEFGRVAVFQQNVTITLPIQGSGQVLVTWQGCANAGLCYPPQTQLVSVSGKLGHLSTLPVSTKDSKDISITIPSLVPTVTYELADDTVETIHAERTQLPSAIANSLPHPNTISTEKINAGLPSPSTDSPIDLSHRPLLALFTLWLLGLGLAFTPCVLPMLPIVAGIVARQHAQNARQGFILAFSYGVGVASSYALLGALVSVFGGQANLSLWLQHPAVLLSFSALFVVLALSSFDVFHLQLPVSWQQKLDQLSQQGRAGSILGTWLMGFFSALVVSPCVSAPLAGVLLSVSTLGDPVIGAAALFCLGFGLSTPLMILGASEGKFMPKAGLWLNRVKQSFGILLIAVALVLVGRVINSPLLLVLWGLLVAGTGFWLNLWGGKWRVLWRSISYLCLIWGACLLIGAASGNTDPLQPLSNWRANFQTLISPANNTTANPDSHGFQTVDNSADLDHLITQAYANNQKVLVDFYADWCVSCKEIERNVFASPDVQQQLQGWVLVRMDITQNTADQRGLLQKYQLFGPPALLFFEQGLEVSDARVVGDVSKSDFLSHVNQHFFSSR
ncbi:protein-disulfide reductase DsbD [Agitococcus lubricus]|nr:protein-disulfide reductase DsbD [Agitococcus lubricus]